MSVLAPVLVQSSRAAMAGRGGGHRPPVTTSYLELRSSTNIDVDDNY